MKKCDRVKERTTLDNLLGSGMQGSVYSFTSKRVIKKIPLGQVHGLFSEFQPYTWRVRDEAEKLKLLRNTGIVPKYFDSFECTDEENKATKDQIKPDVFIEIKVPKTFYIMMERIQNSVTLSQYIESFPGHFKVSHLNTINRLLYMLNVEYKTFSTDMHTKNILVQVDPRFPEKIVDFYLIDLGLAFRYDQSPNEFSRFTDAFCLWRFLEPSNKIVLFDAKTSSKEQSEKLKDIFFKLYKKYSKTFHELRTETRHLVHERNTDSVVVELEKYYGG